MGKRISGARSPVRGISIAIVLMAVVISAGCMSDWSGMGFPLENVSLSECKSLFDAGDYDDTIEMCKSLLAASPPDLKAWELLGDALFMEYRFGEAREAYSHILETTPTNLNILKKNGDALWALGDYEGALEMFATITEHDPENENAWYWRGRALLEEGRDDEALSAFEQVYSLDPGYPTLDKYLGSAGAVAGISTLDTSSSGGSALSFSDALPLSTPYHYEDSRKENSVSLVVETVDTETSMVLQDPRSGAYRSYTPKAGSKFLLVLLEFHHLGHKGGGIYTTITTPEWESFELIYGSSILTPGNETGFIRNKGILYEKKTLNRHDSFSRWIVFEIPESDLNEEMYLRVTLSAKEKPIWKLS